jgi:DNA-binding response OmpR family regulator
MDASVIEDEPQLRVSVKTVLQKDGLEVAEAESVEQAFDMLRELY